jgi:hypothetical protein
MKKFVIVLAILAVAGSAWAAVNVPPGVTGLWRFQSQISGQNDATMAATIGLNMVNSKPYSPDPASENHTNYNGYWFQGPWTDIGVEAWHTMFSDGGVSQERSWDYLTVHPNFGPNGGGDYVNQYTVAIDYQQTGGLTAWNSLFQTAWGGNDNDGDLFTDGAGHIGIGDVGYSTQTYDASQWHRIVWSVDNSSFFRVYVDGALFLDGAGQGVDGRFALYPEQFHLFADNSWEDQWGLVGTVATWGRALTTEEVAGMGGWSGGSGPTPLIIPEPATITLLAIAGLALLFGRKWFRK